MPSAAAADPVAEVQRITVTAGDGASEVQVVRSEAASASITGSFVVISRNPTTGLDERTQPLSHNAQAADLVSELNALPSVLAVDVTRSPSFRAATGTVTL